MNSTSDPRPFKSAFRAPSGAIFTAAHHYDAFLEAVSHGEYVSQGIHTQEDMFDRMRDVPTLRDDVGTQLWEEGGFLGSNGVFYTRAEASAIAGKPGDLLDSWQWDLVSGKKSAVAA